MKTFQCFDMSGTEFQFRQSQDSKKQAQLENQKRTESITLKQGKEEN
jgi:hypothetical protein